MHRTYLADIERGGRNVTLRSISRLAEALEVPAERLLGCDSDDRGGEVLLVEDNEADVELTRLALERAGVVNPMRVVPDGEAAIAYLIGTGKTGKGRAAVLPQVVLLDLNLPGMSGLDVLRRMRRDERARELPVIVLTASRQDRDIMECARLGAENYIVKPVSFDGLCRVTPKLSLRWALLQPAPNPGEDPPDASPPGV